MDKYNNSLSENDYDPDLISRDENVPSRKKNRAASGSRQRGSAGYDDDDRRAGRRDNDDNRRPARYDDDRRPARYDDDDRYADDDAPRRRPAQRRAPRRPQRPDYDAEANRQEIARRDRERRDRENDARLERARKKEAAERQRRDEIARERAKEQAIRDAERAAEKARRAAEREKARRERKPFRESKFVKFFADKRTHAFLGVVLICVAVYLVIAAISFIRAGIADQSAVNSHTIAELAAGQTKVENTGGPFGAVVTQAIFSQGLGLGSIVAIVYLGILGLWLMGVKKCKFWSMTFKSLLVAVTISIVAGFFAMSVDSEFLYGGVHGQFVNKFLVSNVEWIGALLVSVILIAAVVFVYLNDLITIYNKYKEYQKARRAREEQIRQEREEAQARVIEAMQNSPIAEESDDADEPDKPGADQEGQQEHPQREPLTVGFDDEEDEEVIDEYAITREEDEDTLPAPLQPAAVADAAPAQAPEPARVPAYEPAEMAADEPAEMPAGEPAEIPVTEKEIPFRADSETESQSTGEEIIYELEPDEDTASDAGQKLDAGQQSDAPSKVNSALAAALTGELTEEHLSQPAQPTEPAQSAGTSDTSETSNTSDTSDTSSTSASTEPAEEQPANNEPAFQVKTNVIETVPDSHVGADTLYDPTAELSHYKRPGCDLLNDPKPVTDSYDIAEQEANKERIIKALAQFDIEITKIDATVGPTVTLYEIVPAEGTRIAKIKRLEDDIAMTLAAKGIRILAPIPGKNAVGIEVPNYEPQTVSIKTVLSSKAFQESKCELPMAMGATITNQVYIADLAAMPHMLVAGATGQGKSVGLNTIIASLLYKKHPAELKFVLIDPKRVEFSLYNCLERHFLAKLPDDEDAIVTNMDNVVRTLNSLCVEMENRYELLKQAGVVKVTMYNELFIQKKLNPEKGHRYLPYIVIVVDEFADLIMTAGKQVETPIARIAQMARAVGMHMIIATQRPSTNVITGLIKANFPGRVAFRVNQMVDSRTILDTPGANQLIGKGDMLFSHNGNMERVQCAYIDTKEVRRICQFIDEQPGFPHAYFLPEPLGEDSETVLGGSNGNLSERDPLFEEVARAVVSAGVASTSSVQRRYSIGYNRAGKIMDQLEAVGIVGPASGGKARNILVDPMQLESLLAQNNNNF